MNDNNQSNDSRDKADKKRNRKLSILQTKRIVKQEREIKQLRKQMTTLLNYQKRLEENNKANLNKNEEIRKNNEAINRILAQNQKYEKGLKESQAKLDEEQSDFYRMALQDNNIELQRLKDLNFELRNMRDEVEQHLDNIEDGIEELGETFTDNLAQLSEALNLMAIKDAIEGQGEDAFTSLKDIRNQLNLSDEEAGEFRDALKRDFKEFNKNNKNMISAGDMNEAIQRLIDAGVTDTKKLEALWEPIALAARMGVDFSGYNNILSFSDSEEDFNVISGSLKEAQNLGIDLDDSAIMEAIDSIIPSISNLSQEEQNKIISTMIADMSAMQQQGIYGLEQQYADMFKYSLENPGKATMDFGVNQAGVVSQSLGNIDTFRELYFQNLDNAKRSGYSTDQMEEYYGYSKEAVSGITSATSDISALRDTANSLATEDSLLSFKEAVGNQQVGIIESIKNGVAPYVLGIVNTVSDWGIDWADITGIITAISAVSGIVKNIAGFFGLGGGGGATTAATGGASSVGGNLLGKLSSGAQSIFRTIGSSVSSIGSTVGGFLSKYGGQAISTVKGLFTGGGATATGSAASSVASSVGTSTATTATAGSASVLGSVVSYASAIVIPALLTYFGYKDARELEEKFENMTPEEQDAYYKQKTDEYMKQHGLLQDTSKSKSEYAPFTTVNDIGGSYRKGLDYVPADNFKATLHAGEMVLPAEEASTYRMAKEEAKHFHRSGLNSVPYNNYKATLHAGEMVISPQEADFYRKYKEESAVLDANARNTMQLRGKLVTQENLQALRESAPAMLERLKSLATAPTSTDSSGVVASSGPIDEELMFSGTDGFFQALAPAAKQGEQDYGVFAAGTLAQAAWESGWGKSKVAQSDKNLFGIKWTGDYAPGLTVTQGRNCPSNEPGGAVPYNRYLSFGDSIIDHGWFLKNNPRYTKAGVFKASTAKEQIQAIANAGYAGDPNYAKSLFKMMDKYNLTQYKQGTPYVPDDQVALLHKGEMIVPKEHNPINNGTTFTGTDLSELIQLLKWGFDFLGKKFAEEKLVVQSNNKKNLRSLNELYQDYKLGW